MREYYISAVYALVYKDYLICAQVTVVYRIYSIFLFLHLIFLGGLALGFSIFKQNLF